MTIPWTAANHQPRSRRHPSTESYSGRTVVVGYDGSPSAQRALAHAATAAGPDGRVVIVIAAPPERLLDAEPETYAPPELLLDEAAVLLHGRRVRVSTRTVLAEPANALIDVAREVDAAVIVIGQRGDSFLERARRGPVAGRLAVRAPCDVLVVP